MIARMILSEDKVKNLNLRFYVNEISWKIYPCSSLICSLQEAPVVMRIKLDDMHTAVSTAPGTEPQCVLFCNITITIITQKQPHRKMPCLGNMYYNIPSLNDALDIRLLTMKGVHNILSDKKQVTNQYG